MNKLEQKAAPFITGVCEPAFAEALRRAGRLTDGVDVEVFDPSVPREADEFAIAASQEEAINYARGEDQPEESPMRPRTPEQIQREVVDCALRGGQVLVVLQHGNNDLESFFRHVNQPS